MTCATMTKSVRFGDLTIKEYPMELGVNPACTSGAPVQIGWEYFNEQTRNLDLYEFMREKRRRQSPREFIIPAHKRSAILLQSGYTLNEIIEATMRTQEDRRKRVESFQQKQQWDRFSSTLVRTGMLPIDLISGAAGAAGGTLRRVQSMPNGLLNGASGTLRRAQSMPRDLLESTGRGIRRILPRQKTSLARMA